MAVSAQRLEILVSADTNQAVRALGQVEQASQRTAQNINRAGSSMRSAGAGIGSFATQAGGLVGSLTRTASSAGLAVFGVTQIASAARGASDALLGYNARLEQTQVGLTTLLGSAAAASSMMADLQAFSARTPFEMAGLTSASQKLLAFGFQADSVIPTLEAVGDAMAAMGQGTAEIDRMIMTLGQVEAKGKFQAEEALQFAELGIPVWSILGEQMGKSTAELQEMASAGKLFADDVIPALTAGLSDRFGGAMAEQSETFNGLLSSVKDLAQQGFGEITMPIFEVAKEELQDLNRYMSSASFDAWTDRMQGGVREFANQIGGFLQEDGPQIASMFAGAAEGALTLGSNLATVADLVGAIDELLGGDNWDKLITIVIGYRLGGPAGAAAALAGQDIIEEAERAADEAGRDPGWTDYGRAALDEVGRGSNWLAEQAGIDMPSPSEALGQAKEWGGDLWGGLKQGAGVIADIGAEAKTTVQNIAALSFGLGEVGGDEAAGGIQRQAVAWNDLVNATTDAATAYEAAMQEMVDANTVYQSSDNFDIQGAYVEDAIRKQADATRELIELQDQLAGSYQTGLGAQGVLGDTVNEYESQAKAIENAVEILEKRKEAGGVLSEQDMSFLDSAPGALSRFAGGVEDVAVAQGKLAAANAEIMVAQDALTEMREKGVTSGPEFDAANDQLKEALNNAAELSPAIAAVQQFNSTLEGTFGQAGALVGAITALTEAMNNLKAPQPIEIVVATARAMETIASLRSYASTPITTSMSIVQTYTDYLLSTPGVPQATATGGRIDGLTLTTLGEEPGHPEWVIPENPAYRDRALALWQEAGQALGVMRHAEGGRIGGLMSEDGTRVGGGFYGGDLPPVEIPVILDIDEESISNIEPVSIPVEPAFSGEAWAAAIQTDLDDILSGDAQRQLEQEIQELETKLHLAFARGASGEELDKIAEDITAKRDKLGAMGEIAAEAVTNGMVDAFKDQQHKDMLAEALSDTWTDALRDPDAFNSGELLHTLQQNYQDASSRLSIAQSLGSAVPDDVLQQLIEDAAKAEQAVLSVAAAYGQLGLVAVDTDAQDQMTRDWQESLRDMEDLVRGDSLQDLQDSVTDFQNQLAVVIALGLPQFVVDGITEGLNESIAALERGQQIAAAAKDLGLFVIEPLTAGMVGAMGKAFSTPGVADQFVASIVDSVEAGRLSIDQALELTANAGKETLADLQDDLRHELIDAILSGEDTEELRRRLATVDAMVAEGGRGATLSAYEETLRSQGVDRLWGDQYLQSLLDANKQDAERMTDEQFQAIVDQLDAGRIGQPIEAGPVTLDTDSAWENWRELTSALGSMSEFTITANVDIEPALASLDELDAHLPHSPARKGPLSHAPNWDWAFAGISESASHHTDQAMRRLVALQGDGSGAAGADLRERPIEVTVNSLATLDGEPIYQNTTKRIRRAYSTGGSVWGRR